MQENTDQKRLPIWTLFKQSKHKDNFFYCRYEIYNNVKLTCCRRATIIEAKGTILLPNIYVDTLKPLEKPNQGKIKVSARELPVTSELLSGLINHLSRCIGDKKWKSS